MQFPAKALFGVPTRATASGAVTSTPTRLWGILLAGGSDASTVALTNDATGAGTPVLDVKAPTRETKFYDYTEIGGILFSSKMYATVGGTGPVIYFWIEK